MDLNDRIVEKIDQAALNADQEALLGQDYEVITASDRLNKRAYDFVEHCAARRQSGKSMLVCIDKFTCGRMWKRVRRLWKLKQARLDALIADKSTAFDSWLDSAEREAAERELDWLRGQAQRMRSTLVEMIVSEGQNEVRDFVKWGIDIIPRRMAMKNGFETPDGKGEESGNPAIPIEDYLPALVECVEAAENHLRGLGFEPNQLTGA